MLLEPKGGEDYLGQERRAALREKDLEGALIYMHSNKLTQCPVKTFQF